MSIAVLLPIANGSEDIETITLLDVLVRAGAEVEVASCHSNKLLTLSRGSKVTANCLIDQVDFSRFDLIALPGGMPGAEHLRDCSSLIMGIQQHRQKHKWLAAICAAPAIVLQHHKLLGSKATCYPAFQSRLPSGICQTDEPVVIDQDNKIVTSQGPATAMPFALTLVKLLFGEDKQLEVAEALLFNL